MEKKGTKVNVSYIKNYICEKGLKITTLSKEMGHEQSYLTNMLKKGSIPQQELKLLCLITGMDEKNVTQMKTVPEKQEALSDQNTELIISYIQDLGKIHTDMLREIKELKEMLGKNLTDIHESQENFRVETHKDSQQILNYFKYGRK